MTARLAQRRIVLYPDPVLRQKAAPVVAFDEELRRLVETMTRLLAEARGAGLAAPQVGVSRRVFLANPSGAPDDVRVYVNPALKDLAPETGDHEEGCLSIPGVTAQIRRPLHATLHAQDLDGEAFTETADGLLARIWQHEADHLDGVLIIDRMTPADRAATKRQLRALETEVR